jgi:heat shock protein HslJ
VLALGLALGLAACDQPSAPPAGLGADDLAGHTFTATQVLVEGADHGFVPGTQVVLAFQADGQLRAQAGCNTATGRYLVEDGRLTFATDPAGRLAETAMGCADERRTEQDALVFGLLGDAPTLALDAGVLTVTSPRATLQAVAGGS